MGLEGKELEELYLRQYSGAGEEYSFRPGFQIPPNLVVHRGKIPD